MRMYAVTWLLYLLHNDVPHIIRVLIINQFGLKHRSKATCCQLLSQSEIVLQCSNTSCHHH